MRSISACRFISFSAGFLLGPEKSKTTQHRFNLLMKRFFFSALDTSLNNSRGSMLVTTLDGNMADAVRLTVVNREGTTLPLLVRFPFKDAAALLHERAWVESGEGSDLEDLRGNLLRNCFHMVLNLGTIRSSSCFQSLATRLACIEPAANRVTIYNKMSGENATS